MKQFMFVVFAIIGNIPHSGVYADTTYVSGHITSDASWTKANNPYIVDGDVYVDSLVTLTIEPGVEVRLDSMKYIMIYGTLNAIGTATDSILISALDTTKRWSTLLFKDASAGILSYCRIEYACSSAIHDDWFGEVSLVIEHNTITNNHAVVHGGGIYSSGSLTITGNTITNNSTDNAGGGIYSSGSATIIDNIISGNSADRSSGGGICNYGSSTITGNTITNNSAGGGGGICSSGLPTIIGNTITGNSAYKGGGILSHDSSTITDNTISGNSADLSGGGIHSYDSPTITGNTISGNSATDCGGGICNYGSSTITGNTITGNSVYGDGGGIRSSGSLTITDNTITNNSADDGGGISSSGSLTITDNTITNNSATDCGGGICSSGSPTITGNTITGNSADWGGGGICCFGLSSTITGNTISDNSAIDYGGGICSFGLSTMSGNTITNNSACYGGSIYSFSGSLTIKYNTINDTTASAIYITEWVDSALIDSNNLYATGYAIYNNDSFDIDARYNYWGTVSSDTIDIKIWDFYDDSTRGIVYYEPFMTEPLDFGIEEKTGIRQKVIGIRVYPNPFTRRTAIKLLSYQATKKASIQIYDLSGRLISSYPITNTQNPITIGETLKAGIYFLKAQGCKPTKIVKLR